MSTPDADIHKAAARGDMPAVEAHLAGGESVHRRGFKGKTPLMHAALKGHVALLAPLVQEHGARVNDKSDWGWTALHYAASNGHVAAVQCLLGPELGADPLVTSRDGRTALEVVGTNWATSLGKGNRKKATAEALEEAMKRPRPTEAAAAAAGGARPPTARMADLRGWSTDEVKAWVAALGAAYAPHADTFAANGVDGKILATLDDSDLRADLGVESGVQRRKILGAVRELLGA